MAGGALMALMSQPASAATVIKGIALDQTEKGLELSLKTAGDDAEIFSARQGKTLQADITNARLDLPWGKRYQRANPAPGIAAIQLEALEGDRVRLTVTGTQTAPISDFQKSADKGLQVSLDTRPNATARRTTLPARLQTVPAQELAQANPEADREEDAAPEVLIPNPPVTIDGAPATPPILNAPPPFLPRAVAPPVGDISISEIDSSLDLINLGTTERVPRLVLRDASAREVLSLLARAANLNLAFTNTNAEEESTEVRVSLDIQDEPVQDVFNYVLQISGLEANRVGRTIFVGTRLPNAARNVMTRSIRLNQVDVATALNFLVAMGAESAVSRERLVTSVNAVEVGDGVATTDTQTTTEARLENQRIDYADSIPLLRGLQVIGDERTNSVTLVGTPRQVQIATAQLTQIDLRRRQVAINVRVIDVDLSAIDALGTSFSFGVDDASFLSTNGVGVFNFGDRTPANSGVSASQVGRGVANLFGLTNPVSFVTDFLLQLQAVVTNGQAKIVTDPTLVVQEGQTAAVQLTQEVVTNVTETVETTDAGIIRTTTFEKEAAGLNLQIQVERVDDNGFVALSVAPSISAPTDTFNTGTGTTAVLLAERQLSSGLIRVRDGQTLILSGIIQESDRVTTSKVPILGDIPLLGALFRSTNRTNERQELIVLLTPQIIDDSDQSAFGYSYTPGEDVQQLLDRRQNPGQQPNR
ncbi:AMIN domain-containing protein [Romeria aff. gracilis LEGE 07310]|uniref:AMIN domain-containing protein n=2 Tax=Vasconcelosia TaxID=3366328 RepID=A0A8J7ABG6_9CYAN|nr:AMIN domain-containing protein [Romeria aff. gracilis LEGE 07310]